MAPGGDRKRILVTALATVRYAVVAVVTVLTAAVLLMVISAVLRSEDIRISIDHGYIEAGKLWLVTEADDAGAIAMAVNLFVIMSAHNPGRRSKIACNKTTVRLLDKQNGYIEIFRFDLDSFTVLPGASHKLQNRLAISDGQALKYLWDQYHGQISFPVMLQLDAIITSYPVTGKKSKARTFFCWPMFMRGVIKSTLFAQDDKEPSHGHELRQGIGPWRLKPALSLRQCGVCGELPQASAPSSRRRKRCVR
ncbi:hypothetical protein TRIUR3_07825 [Triticum urartu]|uniref:Late embryogenesis abundant protein LEA-2 subgroup domain-containing protein n=1 Tax=Triticum urartu TaxID=4572 RepID=M7YGE6_TRIUA|nr:hypothetical protein TRIUR3_07825 [Triticum urartu]